MNIICIEKSDKSCKIRKYLNFVSQKSNKIIIYSNNLKTVKKIKKILVKEKIDKVLLNIELKKDKDFVNLLNSNEINLSDERWLFKMLTNEVIAKVLENRKKQESELWITINDVDSFMRNTIYKLAKEFKRVNIVTNHIGKFRKLEEKLYEDDGIMMTVTNNRRKSLSKANLILNVDFPKELINQFNIYENATIVNLEGNINIKKKRFCGKIINDIKIKSFENDDISKFVEQNELENYDIKDICNVLNIVPTVNFEIEN